MKKIQIKLDPIRQADIQCKCIFCGHQYVEGNWHHDTGALNVCMHCFFPSVRLRGFGMPLVSDWLWMDPEALIMHSPTRLLYLAMRHLETAIGLLERECKPSN